MAVEEAVVPVTSTITGGDLLARSLAAEGVELLFGIPCPEVDPILASLEPLGMRWVPVRHEAAAVHMAEGVYKTTGKVAAVLGNPGPGSANLLPGVITARHEGVPVFVITTQHRLDLVYPSPPSTFQGQDQLDVFKPTVKWGAPVLARHRLAEVVRLASREMWSGRPGPVHLEIPAPVLYETAPDAPAPSAAWPLRPCLPQPSEEQVAQAAAMLASAQRPLVIAGSGVDRAGANRALLELIEILDCPVVCSMSGRAAVPLDHPRLLYGFGAGGDLAKREADVVLVAGSRLGNLDLPYDKYWGDPRSKTMIQIDIDARHLGVTRPLALGIVADAEATLRALVRVLAGRTFAREDREALARYREAHETWWRAQFGALPSWDGPAIHPARAAQAVGSVFGRDAIYVTDGGMTSLWSHWFLPPTRPRSYHSILELGMLGTGVPSAIGAKLAAPERQVVCVTGDGAAGFHFMEMQSAAREGVEITTVVFAEGAWTMEEPNERMRFGRTFGTAMGTVRWARVAEGLGCQGEYAETIEQVEPALERARAGAGPAVVCLRTDHDANLAVPPQCLARFAEVYQGAMD
jgi:acetolactate synthase-1/2/3 large subunit